MPVLERPDPAIERLDRTKNKGRNIMVMEAEHSPEQWQALIVELKKVMADPTRSREDRAKAQSILDRIGPRRMPTPKRRVWTDESFYTDDVI